MFGSSFASSSSLPSGYQTAVLWFIAVTVLGAWILRSSTVELIGGSGGYLTCPVSPTVPIFAVNPAVAETLGNWDCPFFPRKPDLPR